MTSVRFRLLAMAMAVRTCTSTHAQKNLQDSGAYDSNAYEHHDMV